MSGRLRALLRRAAAVTVFAVAGTSVAYGMTSADRTDLPGLGTLSDGRWNYPELTMPPLPKGSPGPADPANKAGAHYADLRALLLPAPEGAKADEASVLAGTDGRLATKDFLAQYEAQGDRDAVGLLLADHGLRHIAARGWTTPDGTRTRVYLLRFATAAVVDGLQEGLIGYSAPKFALRGAVDVQADESLPPEAEVAGVRHSVYAETEPSGDEQVREAYLVAGDTLALIVQSRRGGAARIPFEQTVVLQSQLLG